MGMQEPKIIDRPKPLTKLQSDLADLAHGQTGDGFFFLTGGIEIEEMVSRRMLKHAERKRADHTTSRERFRSLFPARMDLDSPRLPKNLLCCDAEARLHIALSEIFPNPVQQL